MQKVLFHILFAIIVFDNAFLTQLVKVKYVFEHFNDRQQSGRDIAMTHLASSDDQEDGLPGSEQDSGSSLPTEELEFELHFCFHSPEKPIQLHVPELYMGPAFHLPHAFDLPKPHADDLFRPPKCA